MIVALDLETTGLDNEKDFIIEVALIKFDEKTYKIVDEFTTLVNPGISIPELSSNLTGITDEMVKFAPKFEEIKSKIEDFIGENPILGHNTYFDRNFLISKGVNIVENMVLDTFFFASFLAFGSKSLSLESLCLHYDIKFENGHRAYFDTKNTYLLFKILIGEFENLPSEKKELIKFLFSKTNEKNVNLIKQWLFKDEKTIDFETFKEIQLKLLQKEKSDFSLKEDVKIHDFEYYYDNFTNFEKRENQIKMGKLCEQNFFSFKKTVIEAPTGIGKSLAYLLPSIIFSKKSGKKVFISTKTKILQDQIYYKEMSRLSENLDINFNYMKIKGKNNYVSLKSFFDFVEEEDFNLDKLIFTAKISMWLTQTIFGELDELFYVSLEYKFLKYINADNSRILDKSNKFLKKEFLYKNKQKLDNSDIVIINHNLLFNDMKNDFSYFGEIENLVIDEAHNIEDVVTDVLKKNVFTNLVLDNFNYFENVFKKNLFNQAKLSEYKDKIVVNLEMFFKYFHDFIFKKQFNENYTISILIDSTFYDSLDEDFGKIGSNLITDFGKLKNLLSDQEYDFGRECKIIDQYIDIIKIFLDKNSGEDYIKIAYYSSYEGVKLEYTILDIGRYLTFNFWDKLSNCFLVSATLDIGDNFSFINKSLKLDSFEFKKFESDFDYSKQAVLYLPSDIGNIKNNFSTVKEFLKKFFEKVKGNTLVLFTSTAIVKETYFALNFFTKTFGTKILAQSIYGSKYKLLEAFLNEPDSSIILGTDSFWEGVDIPGEQLKYLIIHKMPFMVPSDPIFLARKVLYKDSFGEYSMPKSILKLKQGFGRLIRTKNDKGAVIFLDNRIYSTDWGKTFYNSFPKEINTRIISQNETLEEIIKK